MKTAIHTSNAPVPMGPFSQAIIKGNMIFVSAQLAGDITTGQLVMQNIQAETNQVMKNLEAILKEAGAGFCDVVKSSIFLKNMNDFTVMNEVYSSYFEKPYPARETIQVADLPAHVNIEISMIAIKP
ncbi:Rid family detoxifying hydrolase [Parafilimonas sp.]|uniref:Rid family detoxifying hydrolase n=1 Tax=Parafilimonas sp. TaxID=1969739 RepID=UPI0039E43F52